MPINFRQVDARLQDNTALTFLRRQYFSNFYYTITSKFRFGSRRFRKARKSIDYSGWPPYIWYILFSFYRFRKVNEHHSVKQVFPSLSVTSWRFCLKTRLQFISSLKTILLISIPLKISALEDLLSIMKRTDYRNLSWNQKEM